MTVSISGTDGITTPNVTAPIQPITASVAASALTLTLGVTSLAFRSSTLSSGTVNVRSVSTPISVVVPSTATLGTINAIQSRLVVIALDNAGTVELAVVNISGGTQLDETNLISTTAISTASDSDDVIYSTTARTSVPYRVVGYVESTQATAGTWVTAPSTIQGYGGQALAAMGSLGYSQAWTSQTANRVSGTTYYNTTGRPISLFLTGTFSSGTGVVAVNVNGVAAGQSQYVNTAAWIVTCYAIVPPNASYVGTYSGTTKTVWNELR